MTALCHDIAFAWRNALKWPAISLLIVVTLALGVGANAAMFSVAYRVLLAPLPFADGERLVTLEQRGEFTSDIPWQPPTLEDFRTQTTVFDHLLGYVQLEYSLLGQGEPYFAAVGIVNYDYFSVLGVQPLLGRGFVPEDDLIGAKPVMLLGYELWQSKFDGEHDVLGRTLEMNGRAYAVVGVLPQLPAWPRTNAVWITWATDPVMSNDAILNQRSDVSSGIIWSVIGKLREGATFAAAQDEVDAAAKQLKERWPEAVNSDYRVELHRLQTQMRGDSGTLFALLLGLTLLVLLIACANVASLHLARLAARSQELAVREAVGASSARIVQQLLVESLLYALAGGIVGLGVAWPVLHWLSELAAAHSPLAGSIGAGSLLLPAFSLAVVAGLGSGLLAVNGRRDIIRALKEGGDKVTASSSGMRRRRVLLVLQLALSFVMLTTTVLILLSLTRLQHQHLGYNVENVLTANFQLNSSYPSEASAIDFISRLLEAVRTLPEVDAVAIAGAPLLREPLYGVRAVMVERSEGNVDGSTFSTVVTANYFDTLDIPLLRGRLFEEGDTGNADPVVIVNANFEQAYLPEGALGRRISFTEGRTWRTIIGVVGNIRPISIEREEGAAVYTAYRQTPSSLIHLFIDSHTELKALAESVSAVIHDIDANLALEEIRPLLESRRQWLAPRTLVATLITSAGILALLISCSGVIGVVSYDVHQRVREIGVRVAIGATPRSILRLFLLQGLRSYLWGLLLGLLLMLALTPVLKPLLYRATAFEASAYLASALLLGITLLLAVYLPALRASRLDPTTALYHQ